MNTTQTKGSLLNYSKGERITGIKVKADKGIVLITSEHKKGICSAKYLTGRFKGEITNNFHLNEFLYIV